MSRKQRKMDHSEAEAAEQLARESTGPDAYNATDEGAEPHWDEPPEEYDGDIDRLESATKELLADQENASPGGRPPQKIKGQAQQFAAHPALAYTGVGVMVTGFALSVLAMIPPEYGGRASKVLEASGLTPGLIVTLGIVLSLMAVIRRQQQALQARVSWVEESVLANGEYNAQCLGFLMDAHEQSAQGRAAHGGDVDALLHSVSRQNEKLNNLTKALKMYGGPLVEVSRQTSENGQALKAVGDTINELETAVEAVAEKIRKPVAEIVTKIARKENATITEALSKLTEQVTTDLTELRELTAMPDEVDENSERDSAMEMLATMQRELSQLNQTMANRPVAAPAPSTDSSAARRPLLDDPWDNGASNPVLDELHDAAAVNAAVNAADKADDRAADQGSGPAHSIAGTSTSSSDSVLGAIAKLKKMR